MTTDEMNTDTLTATPERSTIKENCVVQAMNVIAEKGLEGLSLREVARKLGVSHQAPYKHFASRDQLLAEVIRRCLRDFAAALKASGVAPDGTPYRPDDAMRRLGAAYLTYATQNALAYRLMFATPWPPAAKELDLATEACAAFDILAERMSKLKDYETTKDLREDALFVWSAIHGVAGVVDSEAMGYLDFDHSAAQSAVRHAMSMIDRAVFGDDLPPGEHPMIGMRGL